MTLPSLQRLQRVCRSLFLASALAACGGSSGSPADAGPGPADAGTPDANLAVTARITLGGGFDLDSVDPAVGYAAYSWQLEYATCAMLLSYEDSETTTLIPEIASAMPDVSADGLTYTFHIRSGFKLSPPSDEEVTAATVKATYERAIDPALESPAKDFMTDVASIDVTGDAQDEVTFTLSQPAGDFLYRVAMPFFCVVPSDTPHEVQGTPVPTAGPYYMSAYTPVTYDETSGAVTATGEVVLLKNPGYQGSRPQGLEEIHYLTGVEDDAATLDQVKNNEIDYWVNLAPQAPDVRAALLAAYGQGSADPRLFVHAALGYRYFALNTSRPVFANADTRRAVQYAIDRAAIGELLDINPDDDYLPPGIPGRGSERMYPLAAPDLAMASQLMGGATPAVTLYIPDRSAAHMMADIASANLTAVGFAVTITAIAPNMYYPTVAMPDEPWDLAFQGWIADYPDPFDFLNNLLTFDQSDSHYSDATLDADLAHAATLTGDARAAAFGAADVEAMSASPMVVIGNNNIYDFLSDRMGCVVFQPLYGIDLAKLCIK